MSIIKITNGFSGREFEIEADCLPPPYRHARELLRSCEVALAWIEARERDVWHLIPESERGDYSPAWTLRYILGKTTGKEE